MPLTVVNEYGLVYSVVRVLLAVVDRVLVRRTHRKWEKQAHMTGASRRDVTSASSNV